MKKVIGQLISGAALLVLLIACGSPKETLNQPPAPKTATSVKDERVSWQQEWDRTLGEAKKEGQVLVYNSLNPEARTLLANAFRERFGINLEFLTFGRAAEAVARVQAEKRAGLYLVDAFIVGTTTSVILMKPEGILRTIEGELILPELNDPSVWVGNRIPFADKDRTAIDLIASYSPRNIVNTELIRSGEITSYKDLLKPEYKGKIVLNDPSVSGSGNAMFTHWGVDLWGFDQAGDFLRQLLRQDAAVTRDVRLQVEWVARGKYPVGLAADSKQTATFLSAGAPLTIRWLKEGAARTSAGGAISLPTRSPHPNATRILLNWLLTKEGQTYFVRGFGHPGTRADVAPEGVHPSLVPPRDLKTFSETEETLQARLKALELAGEIMAALRTN